MLSQTSKKKPSTTSQTKSKSIKTQRVTKIKSLHKVTKRFKHSGWAGRVIPKVLIPVKTHGPNDFLNIMPTPGQFFEDPQGVEPFNQEMRGAQNLSKDVNNQWRLMAGVKAKPYPAKVGFTRQDTLYTFARRVSRLEMKHFINGLRDMEEQRIERNYQVASRQANEIRDRSTVYRAWRLRRKLNKQYDHVVRQQKHAAALAAGYARGQENERQRLLKLAQHQQKYLELMMDERRTTWIDNPDRINSDIFNQIEHPTGWWPKDDTKRMSYSKFETDDHDIEKYFTTTHPPYTPIRPRLDGVNEFYDVIQNGEPGWRREDKALMERAHKYIDLDADRLKNSPRPVAEIELPEEDAGEPEFMNREQARAAIRSRTFMLHERQPNEIHGVLRNTGSASYVEKPKYEQIYKDFDYDGPEGPLGDQIDSSHLPDDADVNPDAPHHHRIKF